MGRPPHQTTSQEGRPSERRERDIPKKKERPGKKKRKLLGLGEKIRKTNQRRTIAIPPRDLVRKAER